MARKNDPTNLTHEYEVIIQGRNVAVTEAMKSYAEEKLRKIDRFNHRIIEAYVIMDITKLEHRCDLIVKVEATKIKVSARTPDMYASIDKATDKLQSKLYRYRTRLRDHHNRALSAVDVNVNVFRRPVDSVEDLNDEIEAETLRREVEEYRPHEIVKRKKRTVHTLSLEEAVMKMELSEDQFEVFRSEEDQKLDVIYRRNDGNYGLIELE